MSQIFVVADYVIFAMTFVVSLVIGIYFAVRGQGKASMADFVLARRKMKPVPVALSLIVTYESSLLIIGYPAEVYIHGFAFWIMNIGLMVAIALFMTVPIKLFHPLKVESVYEYLAVRYREKKVRSLAAFLGSLSLVIGMALVLLGPALALRSVTNIPEWVTIVLLGSMAMVYTSVGGMKAVIWADAFQFTVMVVGLLTALVKGTIEAGGVGNVIQVSYDTGRLGVDTSPNPLVRHSVWTLTIGVAFRMITLMLQQLSVQRINSLPTEKDAKKMFWVAMPGFIFLHTLAMAEGLVAFAYFSRKGCDPLAAKQIHNPNQIMPFFVADVFRHMPGLPGLFLATLSCASLSTVSSALSALSAILSKDLVKPLWPSISDLRLTYIANVSVVLFATLAMAFAIMARGLSGPLSQINASIIGAIESPLAAIFLLSAFISWVTPLGVFLGGSLGVVFAALVSGGYNFSKTRLRTPWLPLGPTDKCLALNETMMTNFTEMLTQNSSSTISNTGVGDPEGIDWLFSVSYQYFGLMGISFVFIVGLLMSVLTTKVLKRYKNFENADPKYIVSLRDTVLRFIPWGWIRLHCNRSNREAPQGNVMPGKEGEENEELMTKVTST